VIIGVTHDPDGRVVQRLSVSTKTSIGLLPNGDRNHPTKLDHFVFLRKKRTANKVEWEIDPELTKHHGEQCRDLHIMLIDDDIENVFPSSYAWWTATERKCWGDGTSATRRTPEKPGGQLWRPCGSGCPELTGGQCKPGGDLRFVLADFPHLGSVGRIRTWSYRSIRQIHSQCWCHLERSHSRESGNLLRKPLEMCCRRTGFLPPWRDGNDRWLESIPIPNDTSTHSALQEIQTFTGGRLAGITAKLTVRLEEATYFDCNEKRKKTSSIWALSLEVEADDMRKLIANVTENARLFAETRKLLGSGGKVFEVVEDEQEQVPEVAGGFYSASANGSVAAEGAPTGSPSNALPAATAPQPTTKPLPPESSSAPKGGNGSVKPLVEGATASKLMAKPSLPANNTTPNGGNRSTTPSPDGAASPPAHNNGNGSAVDSGFNQLRNDFLAVARRVATTKKQRIGEVVEWASGGAFKYGDVGRMTEADAAKLRAATELMASGPASTAH
jgi:hypothetical protein